MSLAPDRQSACSILREMPVPLLDLKAQYRAIKDEIEAAVLHVLATQYFILGEEVADFERELAEHVGIGHAVGVASGSDALLVALMALDVGPGDEVITTPYTFFATAGAITRLGARPVFVDIEPRSFNICPEQVSDYLAGRHPLLNDRNRFDHNPQRVKAVIPVHLFGQCAEMEPLLEIAKQFELPIVEDAAQAIGSSYQGRSAGAMGTFGCFSFFPSKNLGACGDAGAIVTADDRLVEKVRVLRSHGAKPKYFHGLVGLNSRLDAMQAAVLRVKLPHLDRWTEGRQLIADRYESLLADLIEAGLLVVPWRRPGDRHVFNQFVIRTSQRDRLIEALKAARIGCEIYYPHPLHLQRCFEILGYRAHDLPHAETAARESLALPVFPEIRPDQQQHIADVIRATLAS